MNIKKWHCEHVLQHLFPITEDVLAHIKNLKVANQRLEDDETPAAVAEHTVEDKIITVEQSKANFVTCSVVLLASVVVALFNL